MKCQAKILYLVWRQHTWFIYCFVLYLIYYERTLITFSFCCNNFSGQFVYEYTCYSDPNSILGGVRLPPDTEIIKYTSSIIGPKVPGTTNRGRKKTISLDPPSVSVHPTHSSTGMLIERSNKRPKLNVSVVVVYRNPLDSRMFVLQFC